MGIKDFFKKTFTKSPEFVEEAKIRKINRILDEREKSSNERELERYYKEQREKMIKLKLDKIRKQRKRELLIGSLGDKTNIFKNHNSILKQDYSILNNENTFFQRS